MKYRIGIDLGTNSLGWAIVELKEADSGLRAGPLVDMGSRIFSDARNPKDKSSNAAQRRGPRGMRRNRDRKLMRQESMLRELTAAGLFPAREDQDARHALQNLDPWILRARALDDPLTPFEIGRALFHLQQRRGFKSNRKTDGAEDGAMFDAIQEVRDRLYLEDARTLGELLGRPRLQQQAKNDDPSQPSVPLPQARVKASMNGSKMTYDYHPDRAMILDEFEAIWRAQVASHPNILTDQAHSRIRYVIEHQRPLKPQRPGKCTFLPEEERAPKALPSAQYARILQEVNNLRIGAPGEGKRALTPEERVTVVNHLMKPSSKTAKRTFKAIRKKLTIPESQTFSHESRKRDHLVGDLTAAMMMQEKSWGPDWLGMDRAEQDEIITRLMASEQFHEFGPWLMTEHGLDEIRARSVFNTRLPDAHGRLSKSALDRLIPHMEAGRAYDEAATLEFRDHRAIGDGEIHEDALPYYGAILSRHTAFEKDDPENVEEQFGRVANPTVHVALNELRKVINDLIIRYGPPMQVVLELARDLPLSDRGLKELEKRQRDNQDANDARRAQLESLKITDSYDNRLKLRLYEEALSAFDGVALCVFSGRAISKTELFDSAVEVEHLLPLSKTLDDSFSNKVLSLRGANRLKGNRSPYDAFSASPSEYDWEMIGQRAARLPASKRWRFEPNAMDKWTERGGFLDRQLNDTRYIARLGKTFVEALFGGQGLKGQARQVWAVPGRLTSDLRHYAGFNSLLPGGNRKERTDHRHHAVDALIVALTDQAMIKRAADLEKRKDRVAHYEILSEMAEPLKRYRNAAKDRLSKLVVSHKPDHGFQNAMHNDTAYGLTDLPARKGQVIVVTRKALDGLQPKDLDRIADAALLAKLKSATDGLSGKAFTDALNAAGKKMKPPVYRVRLREPMSEKSLVTIRHGEDAQHIKAYKGDGNYCYDIWMGDKGRWTGEVITTFQAYEMSKADKNWWRNVTGRAGQPLIMRLRKGDMVEMDWEDKKVSTIVYKFSDGKINLALHNEANASARVRAGDLPNIQKAPSSLQKANACALTISPAGRVKRHNPRAA